MTTDTPPFYEVECTCGETVLIACDADGEIVDGSAVDCPGCGHAIAATCYRDIDGDQVDWRVYYKDVKASDTLCATYYEDDVPDGCELLEAR